MAASSSIKVTTELLQALLSADTQRRHEAESYFQGLSVQERVTGLLPLVATTTVTTTTSQQSPTTTTTTTSHLAAVLLRRDILRLTDSSAVESLTNPLLESFLNNDAPCTTQSITRVAIGYCLAEICGAMAVLSPKDKELVSARILNAISSVVAQGDVPSLRLLTAIAERAPAVFSRIAAPALENLTKQISSTCLSNTNTSNASSGLLGALMQVLVQAAIATQQSQDGPLLPFAFRSVETVDPSSTAAVLGRTCLPTLIQYFPVWGTATLAILQEWTQAASSCPSFLAGDRAVLEAIMTTCITLACMNHQSEPEVALAAMEVISSLCAVWDVKRKILSRDDILSQKILRGVNRERGGVIALTAHFMTFGLDENVDGWAREPPSLAEEDPWDGDDTARHAEVLFQSFVHSFGSKSLAVALPLVRELLQPSRDWRLTCAGIAMMEACLAFAPLSFAPNVTAATEAALDLARSHQQVRVQWQALRLLGVLCETTSKNIDDTHRVRILQTVAQLVQSRCVKVSCLACSAIVSYSRGNGTEAKQVDRTTQDLIVAHLPLLMKALTTGPLMLSLPRDGGNNVVVMTRAIGAVACLAQTSCVAFAPYYGSVMPGLLAISQMQTRGNYEFGQLIAASIESATIVGQVVVEADERVRARYLEDAALLMQLILSILQQPNTLPLGPLLSACARIAIVMEADYVPYVGSVLPHLLQRAAAPPDVCVTEGTEAGLAVTNRNELEIDDGFESVTVATPAKGIQKVTVNTSQIQEKAQAARAAYEHATALGSDFGPFVESSLPAFSSLITFQFSPEVRSTSAQAVAAIFESACAAAATSPAAVLAVQKYFPILVKSLTKQIAEEDTSEMEALFALADALNEVLFSVYQRKGTFGSLVAAALSFPDAAETVGLTMEAISICLARRSDMYRVLSGQDGSLTTGDEKAQYLALLRDEERLLTPLVDSVGYTLKLFKAQFVPLFEKFVAPVLGPCLTNGDIRARLCALCLYDDCVEYCGPEAATKHSQRLIYGVVLGIDDDANGGDLEVKSAAIYGVSQICRHASKEVLTPHLDTILYHLMRVVKASTKDLSDSPMMYENAVAALASLTLFGSAPFTSSRPDDLIALFVNNLPLREDPDEAKVCHAGFSELIEKGLIRLNSKVLAAIGEILFCVSEGEGIASQETCSRLAIILVEMQQKVPSESMNEMFARISNEAQKGINLALQESLLTPV